MRFLLFQAASFLSAFLLFGVQPYAAKTLLPAFGGSAVVWATCVVSFQGLLCVGYLLSHALLTRFSVRHYGWWHLLFLLAATILFRPLDVSESAGSGNPVLPILAYLGVHVAFPFLLLSFSTPLLQRWLAHSALPQRDNPYRLFSPSNLGSLVSLLAYPFLIQISLTLPGQGTAFRWGLALLTLLLAALQVTCRAHSPAWEPAPDLAVSAAPPTASPVPWRQAFWAVGLLSAGTSALLLAITNAVAFNISSAPLLWILPLSLYLLTFIVCFKKRPWRMPALETHMPWWTALGLILFLMIRLQLAAGTVFMALAHYAILFSGCLAAHTLVARLRPRDVRHLTLYYAIMSAGGFAGSMLVSWIIPIISDNFVEYPLAMALVLGGIALGTPMSKLLSSALPIAFVVSITALLFLSWSLRSLGFSSHGFLFLAAFLLLLCLGLRRAPSLAGIALALLLGMGPARDLLSQAHNSKHWRNFYGIYETYDYQNQRFLLHGPIQHGHQYLSGPKKGLPLSYYHPSAPAGDLLQSPSIDGSPRRLGMIGLGTGALTAYARSGETFDIFELDSLNVRIARSEFTYLAQAEARGVALRVEVGDGRLSLQQWPDDSFDYLIIDAFTGGAIPMHLLTVEAFSLYERVVKDRGVVLIHISNHLLDLAPLITSIVRSLGHEPLFKDSQETRDADAAISQWALFSPDAERAAGIQKRHRWFREFRPTEELPKPWTDQFSNLLSVLAATSDS